MPLGRADQIWCPTTWQDEWIRGREIAHAMGRRVRPDVGEELHPDIARPAPIAAIGPALAELLPVVAVLATTAARSTFARFMHG
jgi:hypothetical protein